MTLGYFVQRFDIDLIDTTLEVLKVVRDMEIAYIERGEPSVYAKIVKVTQD
jgi:hypothetical protein